MVDVRGRFAPSPTGPLHLGSLITALASYCSAHQQHGEWLIRIDNIDPPREDPQAIPAILASLAAHRLHSHTATIFQGDRLPRYREVLAQLQCAGVVYACECSRAQLQQAGTHDCLGPCRDGKLPQRPGQAWRLRSRDAVIEFVDGICGAQREHLALSTGDFVVWRRDDLPSYQLANVVDDHDFGITDVVRGDDLLDNTARQCWLFDVLGWARPRYAHLPVLRNEQGQKLSKQNHAPALDDAQAISNLRFAMNYLRMQPTATDNIDELLQLAIAQWQPSRLHPNDKSC